MNAEIHRNLITRHFNLTGDALERFIINANHGCGCFDWSSGVGNCAYCRLTNLLKMLNK